ncbi:CpaB family protein [Robertmurraya massiliosenegalensis]|uniref:hypothetical protein n=1 Tax=Robertmurraya massiliosenegalensis TaxID=1287657 RepID=UPI0002DC3B75|nr:hypothetical protein [Robertmurraya massiliosenegalensis]
MKKVAKILVPLLFLGIGIGSLISYEFYFSEKINTVDVLVAKEDISFKELLTEENTELVTIRKDNMIKDAIIPTDTGLVLNKNAAISIKKGTQIYSELIDEYNLIPNEKEGEFIAPVPESWLFAVPGSLRRTFIADFYAIPDQEQDVIRSLLVDAQKQNENNVTAEASDTSENNEEVTNKKPINNSELSDMKIIGDYKPILADVRVSAVKDKSNTEVSEIEENTNATTGSVANIEIIANEEKLKTLREYTEKGYKLYVVYKYER